MTDEGIKRARELCDAATPGPWSTETTGTENVQSTSIFEHELGRVRGITLLGPDGDFACAARTGWPAALDEIERLRTRNQELLAAMVRVTNETPFPDEVKGWEAQRAKMIAEVGTLRAEANRLRVEVEAMRAVVEAAGRRVDLVKSRSPQARYELGEANAKLVDVVDAYRKARGSP